MEFYVPCVLIQGIKRPARDRWVDSFQIWQMYAVALGNFLEYAVVTFQPIREVT